MKKQYVMPSTEVVDLKLTYTILSSSSVEITDSFADEVENEEERHLTTTDDEYEGEFYARTTIDQEFWTD